MKFKHYFLALSLITSACFAHNASEITIRPYNHATDENNVIKLVSDIFSKNGYGRNSQFEQELREDLEEDILSDNNQQDDVKTLGRYIIYSAETILGFFTLACKHDEDGNNKLFAITSFFDTPDIQTSLSATRKMLLHSLQNIPQSESTIDIVNTRTNTDNNHDNCLRNFLTELGAIDGMEILCGEIVGIDTQVLREKLNSIDLDECIKKARTTYQECSPTCHHAYN